MHGSRFHASSSVPPFRFGAPRRSPRGCIAYIADPSPARGAEVVFDQKRAIDDYARHCKVPFDSYVVDSGSVLVAAGIPHGLYNLLCAVRGGDVHTVLVEHLDRFASDYAVALRIAAAILSSGVAVHEACGGGSVNERDLAMRLSVDMPCCPRDRADVARATLRRSRPRLVGRRRNSVERAS